MGPNATASPPRRGVRAMVAAGGALGGLARHGVNGLMPATAAGWPWSTLTVNVVGAALLGLVVGWLIERPGSPWLLRPLLGTGFCGAFTTFSAFMVHTDGLIRAGRPSMAVASVLVATGAGLTAAHGGIAAGRRIGARP